MGVEKCQLCGDLIAEQVSSGVAEVSAYDCRACGSYSVSTLWRDTKIVDTLEQLDRLRLCGVVREATDASGRLHELITTESYKAIIERHRQPASPLAQVERLLIFAGERASFLGDFTQLGRMDALARRLYFSDDGRMKHFLLNVKEVGYFRELRTNEDSAACVISERGWNVIESFRKRARSGDQAFVAMWFHDGLKSAFDEAIGPALRKCNYTPFRVDRAPSDDKIDNEIVANIRKSRLLVADLTGCRPSVFYEAGLAHGLQIPLVLTCNRDAKVRYEQVGPKGEPPPETPDATWFDHVKDHGFDLRNHFILGWSTHEELKKAVENNILARGLELPRR